MNRSLISPTSLLLAAVFLTTGALASLTHLTEWYSVWMMLAVAGGWAILVATRVLAGLPADRRVVWAAGAVAAVSIVSSAVSGHAVYSAIYDSYAHMPLVIWLAALGVFVLASKLHFATDVRNGLVLLLALAALPVTIGLGEAALGRTLTAMGNSNYYVSVMAMLAVLALGVARTSATPRGRIGWRIYALVIAGSVLAQGTLIGFIVVPLGLVLIVAVDPSLLADRFRLGVGLRVAAAVVAGAVVAVMIVASVPALSGSIVTPARTRALGANAEARLDLWQGAQHMTAERPLLGYGPGGYKVRSAGFAGPAAYRVAALTDPIEVAPPSPHSVLWTAATTIGLVGLAALLALGVVWVLVLKERASADASSAARSLRLSLALAFAAHVIVLLTVPVSVAQGLLPATIAGLAIASPTAASRPTRHAWQTVSLWVVGVLAIVLAASSLVAYVAYRTMAPEDMTATLGRFQLARALQPGDPLYRYREYEYRLLSSGSQAAGDLVRSEVDAESGVIATYAPGLVGLAALSLDEASKTGRTDLTWERGMLERAADLAPYFPTLVAERLHLAALSGDQGQLRAALAAAKQDTSGLPLLQQYISRAESMVTTPTP